MDRRSAFTAVILTIVVVPTFMAALLPKAIFSAVNGEWGLSWCGFWLVGIFLMGGVAALISAIPHLQDEEVITHQSKNDHATEEKIVS